MSEVSDTAIRVENVSKTFRLPHDKNTSIKSRLINFRSKGYEEQIALKDISFEVKKGDFFGIVGRNGSGKSTLLKLISGIYTPDSGVIQVEGKLVPFIELGVGFNPELTGRDNVFLNGALIGFSKKEMEDMYDEIVEFAELERFMDQKLKNYSSGMQVRLAFSIAIRAKADILVLDEVLAVGDEAFQRKCNQFFQTIKKDRSKTIILVTHGMDAIREYCNKALLIESGTMKEISRDVNTVADNYSRLFISKTKVSHNTEKRFGSGELTIENIEQQVLHHKIIINFDIVSHTNKTYENVVIGININNQGNLVTGNNTRFISKYSNGITIAGKSKKHLKLEFDNMLSKNNYTTDLSLMVKGGIVKFDTIIGATDIEIPNPSGSDFYKIQIPLTIKESDTN